MRPDTDLDAQASISARQAAGPPVILDLGCGARKVPGACDIDIAALPGVDLIHNLEYLIDDIDELQVTLAAVKPDRADQPSGVGEGHHSPRGARAVLRVGGDDRRGS